ACGFLEEGRHSAQGDTKNQHRNYFNINYPQYQLDVDASYSSNVIVMAGEVFKLEANVTGRPLPSLVWTKEGKELEDTGKLEIKTSDFHTTLTNKDSLRRDGGAFTLTASNPGGFAKFTFNVKVLDRPGPPDSLTVTDITAEKCVLNWLHPTHDGGAKIEYFVIQKRETSRLAWTNVATDLQANRFKVTKLLKGNEYIFRVMAVNKYGVGEPLESEPVICANPYIPSDPPQQPEVTTITKDSMVVCWERPEHDGENNAGLSQPSPSSPFYKAEDTIFQPGPPGNPRVLDTTKSSITLAWNKPVYDGGSEITGYIVETCLPEEDEWTIHTPKKGWTATSFTITNLKENQEYKINICATNCEGVGEPAAVPGTPKAEDRLLPPEIELGAELRKVVCIRACSTLRLFVPIKGRPAPEVKWSREHGQSLDKANIEITSSFTTLQVENVDRFDGGKYMVTVENASGTLPSKAQIETGDNYTQLSIDICDRYDAGKYILNLENSAGTKSAFVSVKVLDTPGAPLNLTVKDIKRESVTLTWEPPLIDGGARIKNYLVEKRESTRKVYSNVDNKCTKTSYRITGLTEGIIYYFRVLAENEFGVGLPVETKDAVRTSEPPLPVGKITLTEVTKTTASLSWEKPVHDGGSRIMGYYIEMQAEGSEEWAVAATTKSCEATVTGLSTGHEYLFRVLAFNEKGKSDPRSLAAPVTAKDVTIEPRFKTAFNTYSLLHGDDLKIEIPVIGHPAPKIEWKKEGQALKETTRLNVSSTKSSTKLCIKDANKEDSGKYTVIATSNVGTVTEEITVIVLDKPGPPTGPVKIEDVSSNYVTLSWEPPEYTGGCQINNYIVEKRDTTTTAWQIVSATIARTTIKVTKLKTGVEYQFRVSAENRYGKSSAIISSAVVAQYPFSEPSAPGTPIISAATKDNMTVEWKPPTNNGGSPILGYHLERKEKNIKDCIRVDGGHFVLKLVNVGGVKMIPINVKVLDRPAQ
uniref:Titin n=1 Tax=Echeneis naucrates TaxID=173247 RepID=A0A665TL93_ECHNA